MMAKHQIRWIAAELSTWGGSGFTITRYDGKKYVSKTYPVKSEGRGDRITNFINSLSMNNGTRMSHTTINVVDGKPFISTTWWVN